VDRHSAAEASGDTVLQTLYNRLDGDRFRRVHRNAIVDVDHVRTITSLSSQRRLLTLSNSLQFIVSKRQAHSIRGCSGSKGARGFMLE
jgi:DNA-binding LytR/AlgR family response regulator